MDKNRIRGLPARTSEPRIAKSTTIKGRGGRSGRRAGKAAELTSGGLCHVRPPDGAGRKARDRGTEVSRRHSVCLAAGVSGGLKSHSVRGPGPISEGGGNASPARVDGRYGEAREARRRKPGHG